MNFKGLSLLILAGGDSRRMGSPKHLLPVSGGTMIDHIVNRLGCCFSEVMVAGRGLEFARTDVRFVEDISMKRTPLVGILSGIEQSMNPNVFVIGCDMPFVKPELVRYLSSGDRLSGDVVVPVIRGYFEPLCAVYSCSISHIIRHYLDSGGSKVTGFFNSVNVIEVSEKLIRAFDPALESFINLNTPGDLKNNLLS